MTPRNNAAAAKSAKITAIQPSNKEIRKGVHANGFIATVSPPSKLLHHAPS